MPSFGDACNLFGSPETVKKKLAALRDHCSAVGRDYGTVLKTKLATIVIDEDGKAADVRVARAFKNVPDTMRKEFLIHGTPEDVLLQIEEFERLGIDYFIMNFEPQRELEAMDLFADEVMGPYSSTLNR